MPVFQQRRGTAAALAAANETPAAGQIYFETDTNRIKIGDGIRKYNALPYAPSIDTSSVSGLQASLDSKAAASHTHTSSSIIDFSASVKSLIPASIPATASTLGSVKIGSNVSVAGDGTISVAAPVTSLAWNSVTGKPTFATVATSGSYTDLTNKPSIPSAYTLPAATASVLGGVKQGSNVTIDGSGVISVAAPVTSLPYSSITGTPTLATVATTGSYADLTNKPTIPSAYLLPAASASVLGGVKIGSGVNVDASGTISVTASSFVPIASATVLGGVKQGSNVTIDADGVISVAAPVTSLPYSSITGTPSLATVATTGSYNDLTNKPSIPAAYTLPVATTSVLGGVKQGSNVSIDANGVISATATTYSLPVATASVLGGVKQGSNVTIDGTGVISVAAPVTTLSWSAITSKPTFATVATTGSYTDLTNKPVIPPTYTLPVATASVLGGVKQGTNITIDGTGVISATAAPYTLPTASSTTLGGVKIATGGGITIDANGSISATISGSYLPLAGGTLTGAIAVPLGSAAAPSAAFSGDSNTGMFSPAGDNISLATNGIERFRIDGNGAMFSAPVFTSSLAFHTGCRHWVNFNPLSNTNSTGTYSQSGTTVTVTSTSHGLTVGQRVFLDFTSGTATDAAADVVTVPNANTFTVTLTTSATTSGNVTILSPTVRSAMGVSSVADLGIGLYAVNLSPPAPHSTYAVVATASEKPGTSTGVSAGIRQNGLSAERAIITTVTMADALVDTGIVTVAIFY